MFEKVNSLITILEKKSQKILEFGESEKTHDQAAPRQERSPMQMAQETAQKYTFIDESQAPHAARTLDSILNGEPIDENDKNYGYLEVNNFYRSSIPFHFWDQMIKMYEQG